MISTRLAELVSGSSGALLSSVGWILGSAMSRIAQRAEPARWPVIWFRHIRIAAWILPVSFLLWVAAATSLLMNEGQLNIAIPDFRLSVLIGFLGAFIFMPPLLANLAYFPAQK